MHKFLMSTLSDYDEKAISGIGTGVPQPCIQKKVNSDSTIYKLPAITENNAPVKTLFSSVIERCSRRAYNSAPLKLFDLSYLCLLTHGIRKIIPGFRKYIPDGTGRNYPKILSQYYKCI